MNSSIQVQLLYVMTSGRTYATAPFLVSEGSEMQDLQGKVKYQLSMDQYPIEFTNDKGDAQCIMARNLETIVVRQLGIVPSMPHQEPFYEEALAEFATQEPVANGGAASIRLRPEKTFKVPVPQQHVHVSDSEITQEIHIIPLQEAFTSREPASSAGSGAPEDAPAEEPARRPYAPRSRARRGRSGRGATGR